MVNINADEHPGLHRYSLELAKYPELTETQYNSVLSDLKQPEESVLYQNARETLICSHLAMILGMAKDTYRRYYGLSMEDYVGLGNVAMVTKFSRFKVGQKVPFAAYMKKVIERYILANVKKHVVWDRAEDVDIELVGISDSFADDRNYDFLHRAIGEHPAMAATASAAPRETSEAAWGVSQSTRERTPPQSAIVAIPINAHTAKSIPKKHR